MEVIVWLLPGAVIGWAGSILMRRTASQDVLLNILVGVAGAAAGSWLLGPLLGVHPGSGALGAAQLPMAVLGTILSLAAVNLMIPAQVLRRLVTFGNGAQPDRSQPPDGQPVDGQQVGSNGEQQAVRS